MFTKIAVFVREFVNFNDFISTLHPWHQAPIKRMPWNEKLAFRIDYAAACAESV
jgi:hypothetical protein